MGDQKRYVLALTPDSLRGPLAPGDIIEVGFQVLDADTQRAPDEPMAVTLQLLKSGPNEAVVGRSRNETTWQQALQLDCDRKSGLVHFFIKAGKTSGRIYGSANIEGLNDTQHYVNLPAKLEVLDITSLRIVSGEPQFRTLDGPVFDDLVVQISDRGGRPVTDAPVQFVSKNLPAGMRLPSGPVRTDKKGIAHLSLKPDEACGLFQVEARSGALAVEFHLALSPASEALELSVVSPCYVEQPHGAATCRVTLQSRNGRTQSWPYALGFASVISGPVQLNNPPNGELHTDAAGMLVGSNGLFPVLQAIPVETASEGLVQFIVDLPGHKPLTAQLLVKFIRF